MRLSRQRRMVLECCGRRRVTSAFREYFSERSTARPQHGHTSVYQNLEGFNVSWSDRMPRQSPVAGSTAYPQRSAQPSQPCLESGAIHDLDVVLRTIVSQIEALTGFEIESYTLQLSGRRRLDTTRPQRPPCLRGAGRKPPRLGYLDGIGLPQERDRAPERAVQARRWPQLLPLRRTLQREGPASSCWGPRPARSVWATPSELAGAPSGCLWSLAARLSPHPVA